MHLFHKWEKWETFTKRFIVIPRQSLLGKPMPEAKFTSEETWQKRKCSICGKRQDRKIQDD